MYLEILQRKEWLSVLSIMHVLNFLYNNVCNKIVLYICCFVSEKCCLLLEKMWFVKYLHALCSSLIVRLRKCCLKAGACIIVLTCAFDSPKVRLQFFGFFFFVIFFFNFLTENWQTWLLDQNEIGKNWWVFKGITSEH